MAHQYTEQGSPLLKDDEKAESPPSYPEYISYHDFCHLKRRIWAFAVAVSSMLLVVFTIGLHLLIRPTTSALITKPRIYLPELELPPLGTVNHVFDIQPVYRFAPTNHTRDAWMKYFPIGKGVVSMDKLQQAGPVAQYIATQDNDGTGRFTVAVFHQMHCLYSLYTNFYAAIDGTLGEGDSHGEHCFDYLRESILCSADTSLEPIKSKFGGGGGGDGPDGFGQVHQCRGFDKVFDWAERFRHSDETH